MAAVQQRLSGLDLPDRYSIVFGGQWEAIEESSRELAVVIALATFLVLLVLVTQYERLGGPLLILSSAPIALAGGVFALWLTNTPLSAPAMIGAILLIGIVVNNAILLRRAHRTPPP